MLAEAGARRVYQEQKEGRRSEGRFHRLPRPPGTGRLRLPEWSRDISSSRSTVGAPRGAEGLPGQGQTVCAGVQVPSAASPCRALHPCVVWPWQPKRLLQPGSGPPCWVPGCLQSRRMPGSLHSSPGLLEAEVFPKCL